MNYFEQIDTIEDVNYTVTKNNTTDNKPKEYRNGDDPVIHSFTWSAYEFITKLYMNKNCGTENPNKYKLVKDKSVTEAQQLNLFLKLINDSPLELAPENLQKTFFEAEEENRQLWLRTIVSTDAILDEEILRNTLLNAEEKGIFTTWLCLLNFHQKNGSTYNTNEISPTKEKKHSVLQTLGRHHRYPQLNLKTK